MTTRVTFYDILPASHFALVAKLAQAAWEKGKRLLVRCSPGAAAGLDQHLWTFREETFLPHEVCDEPGHLLDAEARIVIVTRDALTIPADILLQLEPAELAFAQGFDTVIDLVDHGTAQSLDRSRARYKAWSELGLKPDLKKAP